MTIPEWAMVALVGLFLGIISWGIHRIVALNDCTATSLILINEHLSTLNGRLGKAETWMVMHHDQDIHQFTELSLKQQAMESLIEKLRSKYIDPRGQ